MRSMSPRRGFSLVELMTTLTVLAILILIGIPSYEQWMLNTRIRTATESIQNGLRLARSEASQRATFVRFQLTSATDATWVVCQLPATAASAAAVANCTGQPTIQQVPADNTNGVQIGATTAVADLATGSYATAITGGVPAGGITYTALGRPSDYGKTSILRIDVGSVQTGSRRLVTTISAGGMVNMCDPAISFNATSSTQGCP